jgi:mannitol-1-/sugar-/sorbitol-6-/2-deoxyglucose-6-phosphatase
MPQAFVFDMDGVIIDSEPLWRRAMVKVFNSDGLPVSEIDCAQTTGMRIDEVIKIWNKKHPFTNDELKVEKNIEEELCILIRNEGRPMPGFLAMIELLRGNGKKIGLATSSSRKLIGCVLDTLQVRAYFHHTQSAEGLLYGKPHPEVFLRSASALGVPPRSCVVIEDSVNGIISAKAAGMKVIGVPEAHNRSNPRFSIADLVLTSLEEFSLDTIEKFAP